MKDNEYLLKHRDTDVAIFSRNEKKYISNIKILDELFSPVFNNNKEFEIIQSFSDWLVNRCIPDSRDGVYRLINITNNDNMVDIMISQHGLSLSDHYWIDKKPYNKKWKDVNFFENIYSEDIGNILFDKNFTLNKANNNRNDPNGTLAGSLRKMWKFYEKENQSFLLKGGSGIFRQEPFNEYFASLLLDELKFEHVPYNIEKDNNNEYISICPCIVDNNLEMISAKDICRKYEIEQNYNSIINLAKKKKCEPFIDSINKMVILDYLIDNEDRHWNNFGIIGDAITGDWIKGIPIFDNGYSLWNNIKVDNNYKSHSSFSNDTNAECIENVNIGNYIKDIPDMIKIFDMAFEKYDQDIIYNDEKYYREKRKMNIRDGLLEMQELKGNYIRTNV